MVTSWSPLVFLVSIVLVASVLLSVPVAASPPPRATVCVVDAWMPVTLAVLHAYDLLAPQLRDTQWSLRVLPGNFNARTTVQSYALWTAQPNATCDVLMGAVASTPTIALSPLVPTSTAWMDGTATSLELSNVDAHPAFSRSVPTDAVGAGTAADVAIQLGWTTAAVLCENTAYGRSLAEAFASAFTAMGGLVELTRCYERGADVAEVRARLDQIDAATASRFVFAAVDTPDLNETAVVVAMREAEWPQRRILLMGDSACSAPVAYSLPGMLCAVYSPMVEPTQEFLRTYAQRDYQTELRRIQATTQRTEAAVLAEYDYFHFFSAMNIDAVRHAMAALYTYHAANHTQFPTVAEWVRGFTTVGLTGNVTLLPNGDRPDATMALFNSQPANADGSGAATLVAVGAIEARRLRVLPVNASDPQARPGRFFWFGSRFADDVPVAVVAVPAAPEEADATLVAVVAVAAAVVVALAAAFAAHALCRADPLAHCPLDEAQPFTVLFVAVANESALYDACTPESVKSAMNLVAETVKAAAKATKCYHAQRVNDGTFMLVAKTPSRALACAAEITRDVNYQSRWRGLLRPLPAPDQRCSDRKSGDRAQRRSQSHSDRMSPRSGAALRRHRSTASGSARAPRQTSPTGRNAPRLTSPTMPGVPRLPGDNGSRRTLQSTGTPSVGGDDDMFTNTSRVSSKRRVPPLWVSVGLATGFGSIDHDPEARTAAYRGDVVNAAAAATDAAVPGQIVATENVVEAAAEDHEHIAGTFAHYRDVSAAAVARRGGQVTGPTGNASSNTTSGLSLHTYNVPGYIAAAHVREAIDRQRGADAKRFDPDASFIDTGNSIAGALTAAATGVALRRAAIVVVDLPVLARATASAASGADAVAQLELLTEIASAHRGHVHDIVGTRVVISVNAVGGAVSAAATRAALIASEAVVALTYAEVTCGAPPDARTEAGVDFVPTAGFAGGSLLCGSAADRGVVGGPVAHQAVLAQAAAAALGVGTAFADTTTDDVLSRFNGATVDVAACPDPQRPGATRIVRIVALGPPRESLAGDGEWLYAFQGKDGTGGTEAAWGRLLSGRPTGADDMPARPVAIGGSSSGSDATPPETKRHAPLPGVLDPANMDACPADTPCGHGAGDGGDATPNASAIALRQLHLAMACPRGIKAYARDRAVALVASGLWISGAAEEH